MNTNDFFQGERLHDTRSDLLAALDSIREGVQVIGFDWSYLYLNEAAAQQGKRRRDDLLGRTMIQEYPGIETTEMFSALRRCMEQREPLTLESEFTFPDHSKGWFELRIQPVQRGILIFSVDISERKYGEERLREQAELLQIVPDAIIVLGLDGAIRYWNRGAQTVYGWDREEVLNKDVRQILYSHAPDFDNVVKTDLERGSWHTELRHRKKGGHEVIVESHRLLIRDNQGNPQSILVVNTDITEKKLLEAQYLRAQRMESIGTLAGGVAHDLNNVLGPIMLSLHMLRESVSDDRLRKIIDTIETSAQRGAELIKQILSFARGVEGERTPVQVKHLVDEVRGIMKKTFPRNISLEVRVGKNLPTVMADATQIHQVLMNLCVNARDAMPFGGKISIDAEEVTLDEQYARMHIEASPGRYVTLSVIDNGSGMPPGILERIFEPFFTTKEQNKGTGLGLSTVLGIVKSHGGFVNVYSEVGKGTTFRVYLPVLGHPVIAVQKDTGPIPIGKGEQLLVIDDEDGIREITKVTLEGHGYRVMTAADGAEALALYVEHKGSIGLVITDMMMPYMDGASTIRALRRINPAVRILAVSGMRRDGSADLVGSVAFLNKPYTSETLLRSVRRVLDLREGEPGLTDLAPGQSS